MGRQLPVTAALREVVGEIISASFDKSHHHQTEVQLSYLITALRQEMGTLRSTMVSQWPPLAAIPLTNRAKWLTSSQTQVMKVRTTVQDQSKSVSFWRLP